MELIEIEGIEEVSKLYCCVCYYPSGKEYYAATPIETVWIGTGGDFYRTIRFPKPVKVDYKLKKLIKNLEPDDDWIYGVQTYFETHFETYNEYHQFNSVYDFLHMRFEQMLNTGDNKKNTTLKFKRFMRGFFLSEKIYEEQ